MVSRAINVIGSSLYRCPIMCFAWPRGRRHFFFVSEQKSLRILDLKISVILDLKQTPTFFDTLSPFTPGENWAFFTVCWFGHRLDVNGHLLLYFQGNYKTSTTIDGGVYRASSGRFYLFGSRSCCLQRKNTTL